jgi:glucose-6-phosphate isomerase
MVVLPYKDSLLLLSRYLQQLVMESLGKEFDLDGNRVKSLKYFSQFTVTGFSELLGFRLYIHSLCLT